MGIFEISFNFKGHQYNADVSVLHGGDHIQYTIVPHDEDLRLAYPTQVIHEFPGKPLQAAFPGTTEESKFYAEVMLAGLRKFLDRAKDHQ
jgi:hypothetical protein